MLNLFREGFREVSMRKLRNVKTGFSRKPALPTLLTVKLFLAFSVKHSFTVCCVGRVLCVSLKKFFPVCVCTGLVQYCRFYSERPVDNAWYMYCTRNPNKHNTNTIPCVQRPLRKSRCNALRFFLTLL